MPDDRRAGPTFRRASFVSSGMDGNAPRRGGSTGRTLAVGGAVLVLVCVVAIASTGNVPPGRGSATRRPSEGFVDTAFSLFLVLMVVCTVFVAVALPSSAASTRRPEPQSGEALPVARLLPPRIVLLAVFVRVVVRGPGRNGGLPPFPSGVAGRERWDDAGGRYEPEFAVWPVVAGDAARRRRAALWLSARGRGTSRAVAPTPRRRSPTCSARPSTTCAPRGPTPRGDRRVRPDGAGPRRRRALAA